MNKWGIVPILAQRNWDNSGTVPVFAQRKWHNAETVPIFAQRKWDYAGTVPIFAQRKWDCPLPNRASYSVTSPRASGRTQTAGKPAR